MVRVRFAPSPTGSLHLGGFRTALYNWLFARHHQGTFILRIEDTDRTRLVERGIEQIVWTLHRLDLDPDEGVMSSGQLIREKGDSGPYIQSKALEFYRTHAELLVEKGEAYWCHCSRERLKAQRASQSTKNLPTRYDGHCRNLRLRETEGAVVRLQVPTEGKISFLDLVHGNVSFNCPDLDDQVLLKADGYPTYHLANVVDDHRMQISHVIRGDEWLPSTPKHLLLYQAFGWSPPQFAHLPLLLAPGGGKLSKRMSDVAVEDFLGKGYLPEALTNFVALLGWNPTGSRDLYSRDELITLFDLERVNRHGVSVDVKKLDALNLHYLQALEPEDFTSRAAPFLRQISTSAPSGALGRLLSLEQKRIHRLDELTASVQYLVTPTLNSRMLIWKKSNQTETQKALADLQVFLEQEGGGEYENPLKLEKETKDWIQREHKYETGTILWPMRVALSGAEQSPSPFELAWILGLKETLKRIESAITCLASS